MYMGGVEERMLMKQILYIFSLQVMSLGLPGTDYILPTTISIAARQENSPAGWTYLTDKSAWPQITFRVPCVQAVLCGQEHGLNLDIE